MYESHPQSDALTVRRYSVRGPCLEGHGPMVLPTHVCVRCGSTEPGGTVHREKLTYYNPWIWLTALLSLFITMIAYIATKKSLEVEYYLCPDCADKRKIRSVTSGLVTITALFGAFFGMGIGSSTLVAPALAVAMFSSIFWLALSRPPLRAVRYDGMTHRFSLVGAHPRFLSELEGGSVGRRPPELPPPADGTVGSGGDWHGDYGHV